jgi:multidrug efflux system outer membrane protein
MINRNICINHQGRLEVIAAQSNVLQSELQLAVVKQSQLNTVTDLYIALGGGWK